MKRYAFIDVQNTESTTNQILGFVIDWHKMYKYLKEKWKCEKILCSECNTEIIHKINKGTKWKSNCDVEFAVDAVNRATKNTEYLFFTGDGDFEYLARDVVEKGVKVYIISSPKKIKIGPRYFTSRLSSKLRALASEKRESIFFVDIKDWKMRIKKDDI